MKWKVEEYENNISERSVRVVDEAGRVIVDNEPYYPQALDPKHAHLIAAAPELLSAQTMGAEVSTPDFLEWVAARLVCVHGENPNADFVLSLRERAAAGRAAIAAAEVQP